MITEREHRTRRGGEIKVKEKRRINNSTLFTMVFLKKRWGKQKAAQALPQQALNSSTIDTASTKRRIVATPIAPSFDETTNSNVTNGTVVAGTAFPQSLPLFGSSDVSIFFGGLTVNETTGGEAQGVKRAILPESMSTRHGQDPSSSSRGRDHNWQRQTEKVSERTNEQTNILDHRSHVKEINPLSSQPPKPLDPPEIQEKNSMKSISLRTIFRENNRQGGSVGKDPPAHTATSAEDKSSSNKSVRMHRNESKSPAYINIEQTDHRDDNSDIAGNRHAKNSDLHDEESSEEYSTRDESESVAISNAENKHHQDDMSVHGMTSRCFCSVFQCMDDNSTTNGTITDMAAHENVTTKSVYNDVDEEFVNNDCSIDEESVFGDEGSSDGSNTTSSSGSLGGETLDPPAEEGLGWKKWFGLGQIRNEDEENEDTSVTPSNDSTSYSGHTNDEKSLVDGGGNIVATGEKDESNKATLGNRSSASIENGTVVSFKKEAGTCNKEDVENGGHISIKSKYSAASTNDGSIAHDPPLELKCDREGCLLPSSKPVRRVPSLSKTIQKLKKVGGSGDKGGDKSIASEVSAITSRSNKSMCSNKFKINKLTVDKSLWDPDDRQRDLYCAKPGGIKNLTVRQYINVPTPNAPDHVLIKVEASTVSSKDCTIRASGDPNRASNPFTPGFQAVGQICALGTKVDPVNIRLGDRVAALLPNGGGNAKYISIPVSWAVILPESAHHDDIICLIANYLTAYQCLKLAKKDGAPLTNSNVLITGGSGPVGQALIELAMQEGANVYATAHKMHEEHLTKLGAKWFSLKPEKWLPILEGKMDVVIDSLNLDGYESSYRALNDDGILICNVGNASALQNVLKRNDDPVNSWIRWSIIKTKFFWRRAIFYDLNESYTANPRLFANELNYLICKLQRGEIQPKVAGRVALNQVPKAQQLIEKGLPNGTVVCLPWKKLDPNQDVKVETCI